MGKQAILKGFSECQKLTCYLAKPRPPKPHSEMKLSGHYLTKGSDEHNILPVVLWGRVGGRTT